MSERLWSVLHDRVRKSKALEVGMHVDEAVFTELLKMTDDELCNLVNCDLHCLSGLRDSGVAPTTGSYKHYLAEIEAARFILTKRL